MSRIGKMPVAVPAGVEVTIADGNLVTVKGPKGTLTQQLEPSMTIRQEGAELLVSRPNDEKENRALHGLTRALLHNMVVGVTEGYIKSYQIVDDGTQGTIHITLKYNGKDKVITGLRRVSKPGLRVYVGADELPRVLRGLGIAIVSTSKGVMTDKAARAAHIGGEVLAFVW